TQRAAAIYRMGSVLSITNMFVYTNTLQSLLWRPHLPAGWTLLSASGDGNPEMNSGDIVWTGTLPPSPIRMVSQVQVPLGEGGPKQLRGEVEYQFSGLANPATGYATPDPLVVSSSSAPSLSLLISTNQVVVAWPV